MPSSAEQLERIAQGIEGLGQLLRSQSTAQQQGVPSLPAQKAQPNTQGLNRAFPQKAQPDVPALPGSFQDAKQKGQQWFGHTGPGRFAARGLNAVSDTWQKFKHGESNTDRMKSARANTDFGGPRGGVQSRSDSGGGELGKVVDLLTKIERNIEKMARQAGKYGGEGGTKTQLAPSGKGTILGGDPNIGRASPAMNLSGIGPAAQSGPSTKLTVRSGGAGGGAANVKTGGGTFAKMIAAFSS